MDVEEAKIIYTHAWANWNLTTDIEERRELENLMDSMQEKIASRPGPEWEDFINTLPGYRTFWERWESEMCQIRKEKIG